MCIHRDNGSCPRDDPEICGSSHIISSVGVEWDEVDLINAWYTKICIFTTYGFRDYASRRLKSEISVKKIFGTENQDF